MVVRSKKYLTIYNCHCKILFMKICYLAIKKETYEIDLEFCMKILQKNQSDPVFFFEINNSSFPFVQKINRFRLIKIRRAASPNSVIIITTRMPAPLWVKRYPRLSDIFINGSFTEPQNYFST